MWTRDMNVRTGIILKTVTDIKVALKPDSSCSVTFTFGDELLVRFPGCTPSLNFQPTNIWISGKLAACWCCAYVSGKVKGGGQILWIVLTEEDQRGNSGFTSKTTSYWYFCAAFLSEADGGRRQKQNSTWTINYQTRRISSFPSALICIYPTNPPQHLVA